MTDAAVRPGSGVIARRAMIVFVLAVLCVVAYVESPNTIVFPAYVATLVCLVVSVLPIAWARHSDPFEPLSYNAFYLAYGHLGILGALIVNGELALPHLPLGGDQRSRLAVAAIILNIVAFVSYAVGYRLRRLRPVVRESAPTDRAETWSTTRLWMVTAVLTGLAVAAYTVFQIRLGRPLFDFESLREGKAVWRDDATSSWMLRGVQLVFVPIALWAALGFRRRGRTSTVLVVVAALAASVMLLRLGQRGNSVYPLIAILGVFHFLRQKVSWAVLVVGMILMVQLTNISSQLRTGSATRFSDAVSRSEASPIATLGAHEAERGRLDSTATILYFFPDRVDYLLGESWRPMLVLLVPRWLDPDKTRGHEWSDNRLLRTLAGFPAPTPLPALLYANFTYLGVVVFMAMYGYFHGGLYSWLEAKPGDPTRTILYMLTLIFFIPTPAGFSSALQYVVPAFVVTKFIERRETADTSFERPRTSRTS